MAILRTIRYKSGAKLLLFKRGNSKYVPSEKYLKFKEGIEAQNKALKARQTGELIPPDTEKNCFLFLAKLLDYAEHKQSLFKDTPVGAMMIA